MFFQENSIQKSISCGMSNKGTIRKVTRVVKEFSAQFVSSIILGVQEFFGGLLDILFTLLAFFFSIFSMHNFLPPPPPPPPCDVSKGQSLNQPFFCHIFGLLEV